MELKSRKFFQSELENPTMVKKVHPKETCMVCGKPAPCECRGLSRKKRLVALTKKPKPTEASDAAS